MGGYRKHLIPRAILTLSLSLTLMLGSGLQSFAALQPIDGSVESYKFEQSESQSQPKSGVTVKLEMRLGSIKEVQSREDGSFHASAQDQEIAESYPYTIDATEEFLGASGTLRAGDNPAIKIRERYEPKSSDFKLSAQDGVMNGSISEAGTYTIEGQGGKKLSKTLDGEASSSIEVSIDSSGNIETFYVYPDSTCSKPFDNATVPVDREGPVITNVSTSPGDGATYVKAHGIYAKTKAELIINATITESGAGLDSVYLIGKKDGVETKYNASKISGQDKYTVKIGLPSEETLLDAETMYLVAVDKFGNRTETLIAKNEDASSVTIEAVPPEISHSASPEPNGNGWYKTLPTITANVQDGLSGLAEIEIKQDGTSIAKKTIEDEKETGLVTLEAVAKSGSSENGRYTFVITAKDNAGNTNEEEFILKIDTGAPVVSFEGAADGGNYKEKPALKVKTSEKTPQEEGNVIRATVTNDKGEETGNFTFERVGEATIPESAFPSDGEYLVTASAKDAAGNESEEEHIQFIYDATKPVVSMAPASQPNGNGWYKELPRITASASDATAGLATFVITEDGKSLWSKDYDGRVRTIQNAEAMSVIDEPSEDGGYTFKAVATDKAGNTKEKVSKLYIDLVAPKLSTEGVTSGTHYSGAPSIKIEEEEMYYNAKGAYILYVLTRDGNTVANTRLDQVNKGTIPTSLFSKDGDYKLTIKAEDAAGNAAKTLEYSFVVDRTKPVITLTGAENGKYYNSAKKITLKVVERYFKTNNVKVTAVRKLNGTHNAGFPWKNTGQTSTSSKTFSETGTYTITASATDKAGNKAQTKTLTFTVDTKAPVINITGVEDKRVYNYGETVAPRVSVSDDYPGSHSVVYTKGGQVIQNPNFDSLKENDGTYTMVVTATDKAGNSSRRELSFVINRFGSYFVYPDETKALQGKAMQSQSSDIVIKEHNVSKLKKSDKIVTRDGKKIESDAKTTEKPGKKENVYTHTFSASNFSEEGKYEINVSSEDEAGNAMESKEENGPVVFYVDRTAPTVIISGIDPKGNKGESATLTINASDLLTGVKTLSATVDGEAKTLSENEDGTHTLTLGSGLRQDIKITATDGAGNTATAKDRASVSTNALSLFLDRFIWPVLGATLAAVAGLFFFLFGKKKKKEDDEEGGE